MRLDCCPAPFEMRLCLASVFDHSPPVLVVDDWSGNLSTPIENPCLCELSYPEIETRQTDLVFLFYCYALIGEE